MPIRDLDREREQYLNAVEYLKTVVDSGKLSAMIVFARQNDGTWASLFLDQYIPALETVGVLEQAKHRCISNLQKDECEYEQP